MGTDQSTLSAVAVAWTLPSLCCATALSPPNAALQIAAIALLFWHAAATNHE
jgi:hypothetical protein